MTEATDKKIHETALGLEALHRGVREASSNIMLLALGTKLACEMAASEGEQTNILTAKNIFDSFADTIEDAKKLMDLNKEKPNE